LGGSVPIQLVSLFPIMDEITSPSDPIGAGNEKSKTTGMVYNTCCKIAKNTFSVYRRNCSSMHD